MRYPKSKVNISLRSMNTRVTNFAILSPPYDIYRHFFLCQAFTLPFGECLCNIDHLRNDPLASTEIGN